MPKTHNRHVCQDCERVSVSHMGKRPMCRALNSMVEEFVHDELAPQAEKVLLQRPKSDQEDK